MTSFLGEFSLGALSQIDGHLNDLFGNILDGADRTIEEIPAKVLADQDHANLRANNDKGNVRTTFTDARGKVMTGMLQGETQLFKQFVDNPDFQRWFAEMVFRSTYDQRAV